MRHAESIDYSSSVNIMTSNVIHHVIIIQIKFYHEFKMSGLAWFLIISGILGIIVIIMIIIIVFVLLSVSSKASTAPPAGIPSFVTPATPPSGPTTSPPGGSTSTSQSPTIITTCPSPGNSGMIIAGVPQTIIATTCTQSNGILSSQMVPVVGSFNSPNQVYNFQTTPVNLIETGGTGWVSPPVVGSQGIPLTTTTYYLQSNGQFIGLATDTSNGSTYQVTISSNTGGVSPYTLSLGNDGNLLIWDSRGTVIWSNCVAQNTNIPTSACSSNK
jgi:hypothetical protein